MKTNLLVTLLGIAGTTVVAGAATIDSTAFAHKLDLSAGGIQISISVGDMDSDGKLDVIAANALAGTVSVYRNVSPGGGLATDSFAPRVDYPVGSYAYGSVIGDVDGDGKLDIVVANNGNGSGNTVSVLRNKSNPGTIDASSFANRMDFAVAAGPTKMALADLDGDGKPDLAVATAGSGGVSILRNTSSVGTLSFATYFHIPTGANVWDALAVDLDGDRKLDLAVANHGSGTVSVIRNISSPGNLATSSFASNVDFHVGASLDVAASDLDGDCRPELVVPRANSSDVAVYRNLCVPGIIESNSFAAPVLLATASGPQGVAVGDLDGDGRPDLAVGAFSADRVSVFQNIGTVGSITESSFAAKVDFMTGFNPHQVALGDLNGDGKPDLVVSLWGGSPTITWLRNNISSASPTASPTITENPVSQTVPAGASVIFNSAATGTPPLAYQWRWNGTNIAGATNATYNIAAAQENQAGLYSVRITNLFGAAVSSNALLTVLPPPGCLPPPSGLVSWWPGESNAIDVAGPNVGVLENGTSFIPGKVAGAFNLDGVDDRIRIPASSSLNVGPGPGFTLEAWINPFNVSFGRPIFEWNNASASAPGLLMWVGHPGSAAGYLGADLYDGAADHVIETAAGTVVSNVMQHVALTYERTNGVARLFINGMMVKEQTLGQVAMRTTQDLYIGARLGTIQPKFFQGIIDEPGVYNRSLTTNEIAAIYAAGSAGKCPIPPSAPTIAQHPTNRTVIAGSIPTLASNSNCVCRSGLGGRESATDTKTDTNFPIRK